MKKILTLILAVVCLVSMMIPTVSAENAFATANTYETASYTEYYEDGSYMVTTITESATPRSSSYIKVGERIVHLYNSSDELQWTYKLIGRFQVNEGVSVVCLSSTYSSEIFDDHWSLTDYTNSYSGNIAYGTATYKKKVLFITTNTYNIDAEIGCDRYGNVG